MYPDKKGREVANFDHCNCRYSADVLSYELLLNTLQLFAKVFSAALPAARNLSPEGLNQRNRKETSLFATSDLGMLEKQVFIRRMRSIEVWGQGTKAKEQAEEGSTKL